MSPATTTATLSTDHLASPASRPAGRRAVATSVSSASSRKTPARKPSACSSSTVLGSANRTKATPIPGSAASRRTSSQASATAAAKKASRRSWSAPAKRPASIGVLRPEPVAQAAADQLDHAGRVEPVPGLPRPRARDQADRGDGRRRPGRRARRCAPPPSIATQRRARAPRSASSASSRKPMCGCSRRAQCHPPKSRNAAVSRTGATRTGAAVRHAPPPGAGRGPRAPCRRGRPSGSGPRRRPTRQPQGGRLAAGVALAAVRREGGCVDPHHRRLALGRVEREHAARRARRHAGRDDEHARGVDRVGPARALGQVVVKRTRRRRLDRRELAQHGRPVAAPEAQPVAAALGGVDHERAALAGVGHPPQERRGRAHLHVERRVGRDRRRRGRRSPSSTTQASSRGVSWSSFTISLLAAGGGAPVHPAQALAAPGARGCCAGRSRRCGASMERPRSPSGRAAVGEQPLELVRRAGRRAIWSAPVERDPAPGRGRTGRRSGARRRPCGSGRAAPRDLVAAAQDAAGAGPARPRSRACWPAGRAAARRPGSEPARRRRTSSPHVDARRPRSARDGRCGGAAASAGRAPSPSRAPAAARARARPPTREHDRRPEPPRHQVEPGGEEEREPAAARQGHTGHRRVRSSASRIESARVDAGGAGLGGQDHAVREHGLGDRLDVGRRDVVAPLERARAPSRRAAARCRARGLAPSDEPGVAAGVVQDRDDVAVQATPRRTRPSTAAMAASMSAAVGSPAAASSSGSPAACSLSIRASWRASG